MFAAILGLVSAGEDLSTEQMRSAIEAMMQGECPDNEIALFLTALRAKGETVAEVAGAAQAMRSVMTPIRSSHTGLVDTCGTGGSGMNLFNISTAAAIVAAAAGVPVAKHGNRGITSKSGSADVLLELGVRIDLPIERIEACLMELGVCFCFAPLFHQSMKHVAAVRRGLGVPTIFNILGPLCNPAGAPFQVIGVGRAEHRHLLAETLARLGTRRALIVHGEDGLDEITLSGQTWISEVDQGIVRELAWHPRDLGLRVQSVETLRVANPAESAAIIRHVFAGSPGPARDIVLANAAAALWVSRKCAEPAEGVELASQTIDSGAAARLLARLIQFSDGTT